MDRDELSTMKEIMALEKSAEKLREKISPALQYRSEAHAKLWDRRGLDNQNYLDEPAAPKDELFANPSDLADWLAARGLQEGEDPRYMQVAVIVTPY